ncbi:hypothetical protein EW146_g3706 [Bondarzewia mesenterica]|uniref:Uncharacterized protein n=1 Tax=Bondarzewia mesenterica TaxID=1095465 RepID=A0A4S4LWQ9_9AGAM|nr:hypothetical protein EW146_g3706 [Bondarzewia mesenterica]
MNPFVPPAPSPSVQGSEPPPDVPISIPPWTLKVQSYLFLYKLSKLTSPPTDSQFNPNNTAEILQGLPEGSYHPFEEIHPSALQLVDGKPQWQGGLATVAIVRYNESPVGPYDELIFIPGSFKDPHTKRATGRVTTIFVSTPQSVWNGRRNWNIQKHLARFEWAPNGSSSTLKVYHPSTTSLPLSSTKAFFSAVITESWLPSLPINTAVFRSSGQIQPPLLPTRYPADSPLRESAIGTDDPAHGRDTPWLQNFQTQKGWVKLAYVAGVEGSEGVLGDGIGYPKCKPWRVGFRFDGVLQFAEAHEVGRAKRD